MNVRLTSQSMLVLRQALAAADREWFGRQMVELTGLSEGTVYPMLDRMEQRGWLSSRREGVGERVPAPGQRRRYFRLTESGVVQALRAELVAERRGGVVDRTAPVPWPSGDALDVAS